MGLSDKLKLRGVIPPSIGFALGYGWAKVREHGSDIAFEVWPELKDINGWDAFAMGEWRNWMFHFHDEGMTIAYSIIGGTIGLLIAGYYGLKTKVT